MQISVLLLLLVPHAPPSFHCACSCTVMIYVISETMCQHVGINEITTNNKMIVVIIDKSTPVAKASCLLYIFVQLSMTFLLTSFLV